MTINQIPPGHRHYRFHKSEARCDAGTLHCMQVFPAQARGQRRVIIDMIVNDGFSIAQCITGLSQDINDVKPQPLKPKPQHRRITFND